MVIQTYYWVVTLLFPLQRKLGKFFLRILLCCEFKKQMTGDFARNSNLTFPYKNLLDELQVTVSKNNVLQNFSKLAEEYIGDAIFGNIILLGYAFQKGLIPFYIKINRNSN